MWGFWYWAASGCSMRLTGDHPARTVSTHACAAVHSLAIIAWRRQEGGLLFGLDPLVCVVDFRAAPGGHADTL